MCDCDRPFPQECHQHPCLYTCECGSTWLFGTGDIFTREPVKLILMKKILTLELQGLLTHERQSK
jgi:hypothetical protein